MQRTWRTFAGQVALIGAYETTNELIRQAVSQSGTRAGIENAWQIVAFERTHGFFLEPAWQRALDHTYHLLGVTIGRSVFTTLANRLYMLGHPIMIVALALWVFYFRTGLFSRLRNTIFICDALALVTYHFFPVAPPRLTPDITYNGHPFHFVDTLIGVAPDERTDFEFAAMPSVHICYALVVGLTLAWQARRWLLRALALLYPVAMLVAVVVTANHYLLDAVGGAAMLCLAVPAAAVLYATRHRGRGGPGLMLRCSGLRLRSPGLRLRSHGSDGGDRGRVSMRDGGPQGHGGRDEREHSGRPEIRRSRAARAHLARPAGRGAQGPAGCWRQQAHAAALAADPRRGLREAHADRRARADPGAGFPACSWRSSSRSRPSC